MRTGRLFDLLLSNISKLFIFWYFNINDLIFLILYLIIYLIFYLISYLIAYKI
jgi:hypothetical protein